MTERIWTAEDDAERQKACKMTPAHQAHMAMNGECPWCGYVDESAIQDMSIEEIEREFG